MKWVFQALAALLFLAVASINPALAFQLKPISQVFAPIGEGATKSYEVVNDSDERIAVEVSVVERNMDIDGQESYEPADEDFLVYPPQMILEPQSVQTVRVTWLGDPDPSQELTYRLVAEQLPINLADPDAQVTRPVGSVQILLRYLGSLYVRPADVAPDVQVASVEAITGSEGEAQVAITLANQGTASARLRDLQVSLTAQGTTLNLGPDQLDGMAGQIVLPGHQRRFVMPRPTNLANGEITATIEYRQEDE
ncbi:hypothetical protein XM38_022910 [Halomicronema hongdechloris C2206]|uniref:Pili assembly chaperone N-terminal domain-containing protein n=1 Tax=Halomicronema hongdechloris C2206 TaxID=1641165 RepID=A0A1Z3HLY7_9CYAN|nr:fimbria/pilus periplasmic chaperone [Halomicronema hongdechloris]ASC71339.1 hypothetical protein XM38_022910 [Halomicronema hongdechloris C2206]